VAGREAVVVNPERGGRALSQPPRVDQQGIGQRRLARLVRHQIQLGKPGRLLFRQRRAGAGCDGDKNSQRDQPTRACTQVNR
jgi:hypothetical protein